MNGQAWASLAGLVGTSANRVLFVVLLGFLVLLIGACWRWPVAHRKGGHPTLITSGRDSESAPAG